MVLSFKSNRTSLKRLRIQHVDVFSTIFQKSTDIRKEEQRKFGVFFDDDYDYMQHLKDVDEINEVEPIECVSLQRNAASTKVLN